jgi:HTH-type transcriptional regulator, transcriptional repressor of NAD biosynthesis genes
MELGTRIPELRNTKEMKRGLVIGKFMPIHQGHVALIDFAAKQCDELIVSMSFTSHDVINAPLRFAWIKEIFKNNPCIKPTMVEDNFDNEQLPLHERTRTWADFIRKTYPAIDLIFSSEEYGEPFARHLGARHVPFDQQRKKIPVAASLIRQHPLRFWDYIPEAARPYYVKKICFYGPESTGKSVMAKRMAEKYKTEFVPEVARELITSNDFGMEDIATIGQAHYNRIQEKLKPANKILFCDTDAITTQLYSKHYLNKVPAVIAELESKVRYDLYFLFDIDVPWVSDGLRDLGHARQEMFILFKEALEKRNIDYILVTGDWAERELLITAAVDRLLQ